jgi:hypothetical protein
MPSDYEDRLQRLAAACGTQPDVNLVADTVIGRMNAAGLRPAVPTEGNDKAAVVGAVTTLLESSAAWSALLTEDAYLPPDVLLAAVDRADLEQPTAGTQALVGRIVRILRTTLTAPTPPG